MSIFKMITVELDFNVHLVSMPSVKLHIGKLCGILRLNKSENLFSESEIFPCKQKTL